MGRCLAVLLAGVVGASCASGGGDPDAAPAEPPPTCLTGVLRASSTEVERFLWLEPAGGGSRTLVDGTGQAIGWLNGAEVEVCGLEVRDGSLEVRTLQLKSVDGAAAHLGVLRQQGDAVVLEPASGAAPMLLRSAPPALRDGVGRTAWITARQTPDGWVVLAYGLRPA